jgi:hypothetical protein
MICSRDPAHLAPKRQDRSGVGLWDEQQDEVRHWFGSWQPADWLRDGEYFQKQDSVRAVFGSVGDAEQSAMIGVPVAYPMTATMAVWRKFGLLL